VRTPISTIFEIWEWLSECRIVRRDIRILRRAVDRAERYIEDAPDE